MPAIMIPELPREFDPKSKEGLMFEELSTLPEDYYVFHSFSIITTNGDIVEESEADFVVFNPKKGILCIEAKAGQIDYVDGSWRYGSGISMKKDGPYNQASSNKWRIKDLMTNKGLKFELARCKLLHAVWFPDVSMNKLKSQQLPAEADLKITLTSDSFGRIKEEIERIFDLEVPARIKTELSEESAEKILNRVLAPSFSLISLSEAKLERNRHAFKKMLKEQVALLNYLEEQNTAVINGLAGTGKTVMAVEKARRHSERGQSVLFLCYNKFLQEHLKTTYVLPNVEYYTIDGLACKLCSRSEPDYLLLKEKLEEMYIENAFPYQHVIIDEGQDFGKSEHAETEIVQNLMLNALREEREGTFYLFYDKNQMIQSNNVPQYIEDADCKLTLYRNCRNTENIATTSLRLLGSDKSPRLHQDAVKGDSPFVVFASDAEETKKRINSIIDFYIEQGYSDISILTCKTESSSIIAEYCKESKYCGRKGNIRFTTCRKFKGLESDAIIVIDIDEKTFNDRQGEQLMYVGSSRARYHLSCVVNMTEDECVRLLSNRQVRVKKNVYKSFASTFNSKIFVDNEVD